MTTFTFAAIYVPAYAAGPNAFKPRTAFTTVDADTLTDAFGTAEPWALAGAREHEHLSNWHAIGLTAYELSQLEDAEL